MMRLFLPSFTVFFPTQVRNDSKRPVQLRDQKTAAIFRVWYGNSKLNLSPKENLLPSFSRSFLLKGRNMISRTEKRESKVTMD